MAALTKRMQRFTTTIFTEISALAQQYDAINLGQGFPDTNGPREILDAASRSILTGHNQYPPARGVPELRKAIATHRERFFGMKYDPDTEVLVTVGATEALVAAQLALLNPGDEVVALEPFYDSYDAGAALAGATLVPVRLDAPEFALSADRLRAAISPRTRMLLLNSPHNPTGRVFTRDELEQLAAVAIEHDLIVLTDEVYEHLVFDGHRHVPIASLPGMRERTISVGSGGKTFSTTGWKVGWITAPAALVSAVATVKQHLTFVGPAPMQYGIAEGLALPPARIHAIRDDLQAQRDLLVDAVRSAGLDAFVPQGGYFVVADVATLDAGCAMEFCELLPRTTGVAAIPLAPFYRDAAGAETLIRFAFSKRPEVLRAAGERLQRLRAK
nr:methionine aminotransferase [Pseudoclavibacter sp. Marseille-Q3772]